MKKQINNNAIILTGGPGMGKTSIINQLRFLGYRTVPESGQEIIAQQMRTGGTKLPWINREAFAQAMFQQSLKDHNAWLNSAETVFFDRGIPDVMGYLSVCTLNIPDELYQEAISRRYNTTVFITPPWKEIYINDDERKQSFSEAIATYHAMVNVYEQLGYRLVPVPKMSILKRANFILAHLELKNNTMTNTIRLGVNHRDSARMEAFLRRLNDEFERVPFHWKLWNRSDSIVDAVKLVTIDRSLTITILFLETQSAADILANANALPSEDTARWSTNGAVMYLVESPDRDKVDHVLSLFAGEE